MCLHYDFFFNQSIVNLFCKFLELSFLHFPLRVNVDFYNNVFFVFRYYGGRLGSSQRAGRGSVDHPNPGRPGHVVPRLQDHPQRHQKPPGFYLFNKYFAKMKKLRTSNVTIWYFCIRTYYYVYIKTYYYAECTWSNKMYNTKDHW